MRRKPSSHRAPPGQRQLRVGEQIRHILAGILLEEKCRDPDLAQSSLITVTAVEIGPDLKHATAFIMPLGGRDVKKTIDALNRAAGYFRSGIGSSLDLRYTPKITFKPDPSFDEAENISNLLRQDRVKRDLEKAREEE